MQKDRSDRRRRWYLRWRSRLARVAVARMDGFFPTAGNDVGALWNRFRLECRVPDRVVLTLSRPDGCQIVTPLCDPYALIGRGPHCTIQLDDPHIAGIQAALVWHDGRLFLVDADRLALGAVRTAVRRTWRWGAWTAEIVGLPSREPQSARQPALHLEWNKAGPLTMTRLLRPINVIGSAAACPVRLAAPGVASLQAVIVSMSTSAWLVNLTATPSVRVNGRAIEFASLDPGDVISIGPSSATVIGQWAAEQEQTAVDNPGARIAELERRLRDLKRKASLGGRVQTVLTDVEQLVNDCERQLRPQSPCN